MRKDLISKYLSFMPILAPLPYQHNNPRDTISEIESRIRETTNSNLPKGASGVYYPSFKTGSVGKDLPEHYKQFVIHHETAHAFGASGDSHGEYLADAYAAERTARPELIRGPFYNPPLL